MAYRYRRYKRRARGGSTGTIKMRFQSFMDISTNEDSMQVITVSAGGPDVLKRLAPQFSAYKYYKLGTVSLKLVPAATLPVEPSGLSYEVDDPGVDPRDQLTPGLIRITNGEDIFEDITGMSDEVQHGIYNNMLLDPRWFKWMLQSGVKRYATPRFWQIGELHQDKWPGMVTNVPSVDGDGNLVGTDQYYGVSVANVGFQQNGHAGSSPYGFFQTGHSGRLGWLPTDGLSKFSSTGDEIPLLASPPEVEVFKILLPKAYKTRYYYRMFITETVYFRSPIVNFGIDAGIGTLGDPYGYRPLDVFHWPSTPTPVLPTDRVAHSYPADNKTGGNYGDD